MGRNGMGKTTLLKSLIGLLPARSGQHPAATAARWRGCPSYQRVRHGLAFVPQGRMMFPLLTVEENILTGAENSGPSQVPDTSTTSFRCCARCASAVAATSRADSSRCWRSRAR